jgi:diguanylate cyclase (GGDEF)-like protein
MGNENATPAGITPEEDHDGAPEPASEPRGTRGLLWAALAALALVCVLAGTAGGLLFAHGLAGKEASAARRQFRANASEVSANLNNALQREANLAVSAGTFFTADPKVSSAGLMAWARWGALLAGHPELQRLGLLRVAGHSQRCLATAEIARGAGPRVPSGLDYCALEQRLLASRGSGAMIARAPVGRPGTLEVQRPVYRGYATPTTTKARNAAFVGWLREVLRPSVLARSALAGRPGYALSLRYGPSPAALALAGSVPADGAQRVSVGLARGGQLEILGPPASAPLLGKGRVWALVAGILLGLLAGTSILLLGTRRRREEPPVALVALSPEPPPAETLYDSLTGLPGHDLTLDRASQVLARATRQSGMLAGALLIDIDWFKDVNEKLGRDAGDQLLRIVAQRLQGVMREEDTVGRLGADRFAVLVECTARSVRMDSLAQRVIEALHKPIELEGFGPSFFTTVSIGVAFGRYGTPDELLRDAQAALDSAKAAGRDRYAIFSANTRSVVERRSVVEAELNTAVQEQQFFLLYEPIWDLASGAVVGLEAQPRWQHPKRGVLTSADFLPVAQESGLSIPIDRWAIEQACASAAAWEVQGRRIGVSVKVSADQLNRDGLIVDVRRALQQSGIDPSLLTLEIAETSVMSDVALAAERLREIKQLGVHLAIEDFGGSGYAYHSDLRKLSLDSLRVNRSSLAAEDDADYRDWLFEAIMMVGRELSLTVIAKELQTTEQLSAVQAMGCTMAQGQAFGEAVLADAVIGLCDAGMQAPAAATGVVQVV